MIVHIASDHAGYELKENLLQWLQEQGYEIVDHGAITYHEDDNFTDFVFKAAKAVAEDHGSMGVVIGGSGQGEAMAANRIKGVRAMVFYGARKPISAVDHSGRVSDDVYENVRLARAHNNANILSIGARFVTFEEAMMATTIFFTETANDEAAYKRRNELLDQV